MSQDFIKQEAQKHTSIVDEVKNTLLGSIHNTNQIGNLFGSTAGTLEKPLHVKNKIDKKGQKMRRINSLLFKKKEVI